MAILQPSLFFALLWTASCSGPVGEQLLQIRADEEVHVSLSTASHQASTRPKPTSTRSRTPVASDGPNVAKFTQYQGSISYADPINGYTQDILERKAGEVTAVFTKQLFNAKFGSPAYNRKDSKNAYPPGWAKVKQIDKRSPNRGHLIGNALGGSGTDVRNIVTLFRNANYPMMYDVEHIVRHAYDDRRVGDDCHILYTVTPNYISGEDYPVSLTIEAEVRNPNDPNADDEPWLLFEVPNEPDGAVDPKTFVVKYFQCLGPTSCPFNSPTRFLLSEMSPLQNTSQIN